MNVQYEAVEKRNTIDTAVNRLVKRRREQPLIKKKFFPSNPRKIDYQQKFVRYSPYRISTIPRRQAIRYIGPSHNPVQTYDYIEDEEFDYQFENSSAVTHFIPRRRDFRGDQRLRRSTFGMLPEYAIHGKIFLIKRDLSKLLY